jgi:hypothetical protein
LYAFVIGDKSPIEVAGEKILIERDMQEGKILFKNENGNELLYSVELKKSFSDLIQEKLGIIELKYFTDHRKNPEEKTKNTKSKKSDLPFNKIYDALGEQYQQITSPSYVRKDVSKIEEKIKSGSYEQSLQELKNKIKERNNKKPLEPFTEKTETMNNNELIVQKVEKRTGM